MDMLWYSLAAPYDYLRKDIFGLLLIACNVQRKQQFVGVGVCWGGCMLEWVYVGVGVCWSGCMLEWVYVGVGVCWGGCMLEWVYVGVGVCWSGCMLGWVYCSKECHFFVNVGLDYIFNCSSHQDVGSEVV